MREITFILIIIAAQTVSAQQIFKTYSSEEASIISELTDAKSNACDSTSVANLSSNLLIRLYGQGFLEAAYSIAKDDSCFHSNWLVGRRYQWGYLKSGNIPEYLVSKTGYKQKFYLGRPFSQKGMEALFKTIISESENSGRPFASVRLDSLVIDNEKISAQINYTPGPDITYDKLQLNGSNKVKSTWLESYLNVREGGVFNQRVINDIALKIERLPFLELTEPPTIRFQNQKAEIILIVRDVKANSLDGILGFLPNEQEEGKLLITGQLYLNLNNLFASGKSLEFQWQSLKARSQLLNINYRQPNIFKSALDLDAEFYLLKEDTFFINREATLSVVYAKSRTRLSVFYQSSSSSGLTEAIEQVDINDLQVSYYGIGFGYNNFKLGVHNGFKFNVEPVIGRKEIELNELANDIMPEEVSIQYKLLGSAAAKLKLGRNLILYNNLLGGKLINDFLYRNDLFRLGGLRSIRGFNENFFFASEYAVLQSELQLYYQPNSYLFLFSDFSHIGFETILEKKYDNPLGLGAGIALKLNAGVLNLVYALGKSEDQAFDTKLSKFHFGYVARF